MSLPPGFLDELRSRISIAQVVGRKVAWDARKTNAARSDYWAPCPFHQEKTASFHVDDAKGYYYCFGCHAKGDAVSFVRETENAGFVEAVEILAREAGMSMPERDPAAAARAEAAKGLVEAMEAAVQFYRLHLKSARGAEARAYLDRRHLSPATVERFEIGFAPDSRNALLEHLTGKGFSKEKLAQAGLIGLPEGGGSPYARFRGRIMFPIRDTRGRPIAFGARALRGGQEPKYLNSPETPLFDKGRSLYNAGPARAAAGKASTVVVVEGYMDVIALAQAGLDHAVAPLGTAITETQLAMIWRMSDEPVVALDGDAPGLKAAHRLVDLALPLLQAGKSLRFALMPPGQDPDDVIQTGGARALEALLAASRPIVDLLWMRETEGIVLDSPERRNALDARLRAHLERISDTNLRAHYQAEIRARRNTLFARERDANRRGRHSRKGGRPNAPGGMYRAPAETFALPSTKASLLAQSVKGLAAEARVRESAILAGCLNHPGLIDGFENRLERMAFACPDLGEIRDALLSERDQTPDKDSGGDTLAQQVTRRLGRDPLASLTALGQIRANPHLAASAAPEQASLAIDEELTRHAASTGWLAEVREAEQEITEEAGEGLTWRLKQAAEAAHNADANPLKQDTADSDTESNLSNYLQNMIDTQIWKKPQKR